MKIQTLLLLLAALWLGFSLVESSFADSFAITGSLNTARSSPTATLLPNGLVLIAGGGFPGRFGRNQFTSTLSLSTAELYNSTSGTWTNTGSMSNPRLGHTATVLPNGLVLVAGGAGNATNTEIYSPVSGVWTNTGSLNFIRYFHTATLLTNGLVLVAGGDTVGTSTEVYNPATGIWTKAGAMNFPRYGHTATLLPDGEVLIAAGSDRGTGKPVATAELYNPASGTWSITGPLNNARTAHTATLLPDGQVLVAGGDAIGNSAELYDPTSGTWTSTGSLNVPRLAHSATLLFSGQVLVAGGIFTNAAELYDPTAGVWTNTLPLNFARYAHSATLLPNWQVLIAGGAVPGGLFPNSAPGALSSAEVFGDSRTLPGVILGNLTQSYDGTAKSVIAITALPGLKVNLTYNDDANAPINVGTYTVIGTIFEPNYHGAVTNTLNIVPGSATVVVGNLLQTYDGSPKSVSVTTTPPGLAVSVTYNGSTGAVIHPGGYTVIATINDPNYRGSATDSLVISKAAASLTLGNLLQSYDGTVKNVSLVTVPPNLSISLTYNGSAIGPIAPGNYAVIGTILDPDYQGSSTGKLVILAAAQPQPQLQLVWSNMANGLLVLNYASSISNGAVFILNGSTPQNLLSSGSIFYSTYISTNNQGSIPFSMSSVGSPNFFTLLQYSNVTQADAVSTTPIDDDIDGSDASTGYFFDVALLPYPLTANQPFSLTILVDDSQGNLQGVNGQIRLSLVDANGQDAPFTYTIIPGEIGVTNGTASGMVRIQTASNPGPYNLAATFTPAITADSSVRAHAAVSTPKRPITAKQFVALTNYQDMNGSVFTYPLPTPYPMIGGFGEYPGHHSIHWGVDFLAPPSTPVLAAKKGIVVHIGTINSTNKQFIVMDHGDGFATTYMHILPSVTNGQIINAGGQIGTVGTTNYTHMGAHLHFEMMQTNASNPLVWPYHRDARTPYPFINPINLSNAFVFDTPLTSLNTNHARVKAALITGINPATTPLQISPAAAASARGIYYAYFLAKIVDIEAGTHPITPIRIDFLADGNNPQTVDYQTTTNVIRNFWMNPTVAGYAALPANEVTAVPTERYKYWFSWDTSSYATNPIGPRTLTLVSMDVTGFSVTNSFSYGPKISVSKLGNQQYQLTLTANLGTNGSAFQQPDFYNLTLTGGATFAASSSSQYLTPVFTSHLSSSTFVLNLNAGVDPGTVILTAQSALLPNIMDQAILQLPTLYALTIAKAGTGTGTVMPLLPGISSTNGMVYTNGTVVTLTAIPDTGSKFEGWSGDASGAAQFTLTMNANKSVTATFDLNTNVPPSVKITSIVSTIVDHTSIYTDFSVTVKGTITGTPYFYSYEAGWGIYGLVNHTLTSNSENWSFTFTYTLFGTGASVTIPIWADEYDGFSTLISRDNKSVTLTD